MHVFALFSFVLGLVLSTGCSLLLTYPDQLSQHERFQAFNKSTAPVRKPVQIYWNEYSIPFIKADHDEDLSFALGVVHTHLRLDQLEWFRIISQGRLSEIIGPISEVKQVDHGLRMLNFKSAARKSLAIMSVKSRQWIQNFTKGINWYIEQLEEKPLTNKLANQDLKPYSEVEVMAISRLVSADLTWTAYLKFLKYAEQDGWQSAFKFYLEERKSNSPTVQHSIIMV